MASPSPLQDLSEWELRQLYDNEEAERFLRIFSTVSKPDITIILLSLSSAVRHRSSGPRRRNPEKG